MLQTHFVYGSNSRLEQVVDHSGIAYAVGYDGNGRVKKLTVSGSCIIADNSVTDSETLYDDPILFEYRSGSTAVKNGRTGAATVYRFDGSGREMSSYRDMTGAADSSLIGESTASVISGYEPVVDAHKNSRTGKYRSLNVTLNGGDEEINLIKNGFLLHPVFLRRLTAGLLSVPENHRRRVIFRGKLRSDLLPAVSENICCRQLIFAAAGLTGTLL